MKKSGEIKKEKNGKQVVIKVTAWAGVKYENEYKDELTGEMVRTGAYATTEIYITTMIDGKIVDRDNRCYHGNYSPEIAKEIDELGQKLLKEVIDDPEYTKQLKIDELKEKTEIEYQKHVSKIEEAMAE